MATKLKPVWTRRVNGIEVAVWQNDKGPPYSVTISRSYKKGEEWKQTDSFSGDDLPLLAKLIDHAHTWIIDHPVKRQADAA
jgi:hypothetical protein